MTNGIAYFESRYNMKIKETQDEFQKGGNKLLVIRKL